MKLNMKDIATGSVVDFVDQITYLNYVFNRDDGMSQAGYEKLLGRKCSRFETMYQGAKK